MAQNIVGQALISSQIDDYLQTVVSEINKGNSDLTLDSTGSIDEAFAEQQQQILANAKAQAKMEAQKLADAKFQMAKAFAFRQTQVGSPGNIKAPARIRNRV